MTGSFSGGTHFTCYAFPESLGLPPSDASGSWILDENLESEFCRKFRRVMGIGE
ncbi:hypothetical protein AKJ08_1770 [Vulgatibacter incomptus]|uniref:Uncharacterized protein n=2 Tax=Vulgatibacter incomptus TaxID=1391653 RepID=A0A0K1PCW5_9BACT|nr:hypothetical protein AKJ08_1770 [Vulgatibacter incomptus]